MTKKLVSSVLGHYRLILASASPRRRDLLANAGIECELRPANIEERRLPGEVPRDYVERLAREKARAVPINDGEAILAADTTVDLDGVALEKPVDPGDAVQMLNALSGRTHLVHTGVCLRTADHREVVDVATTEVVFLPLSSGEIAEYVATGDPMDKAGAYGIQGIASRFVERVNGCYFNVMGLPVSLVWRRLRELGD